MSSYNPPDEILSIFNSLNYLYGSNDLTITSASRLFLSLSGGTLSGSLYCPNLFSSGSLGGTITTAAQPNITSIGTLTTLKLNGSFDFGSNVNTTRNDNLIITGSASSPTSTNGLGFAFSPATSTGRIKAYNYALSQYNNLHLNDAIYVKSDLNVAIGGTTPSYKLDITGTTRVSSSILVGSSTDTTRMISCLDSTMTGTQARYITLGKDNTAGNQVEVSFYYAGDNNASNRLDLGFHSNLVMSLMKSKRVGIANSAPSYTLDVTGDINTSESYRMDGTQVISTAGQFNGQGGVDTSGDIVTSGRLKCANDLGFQCFPASGTGTTEFRIYCGASSAFCGLQTAKTLYLGVNNGSNMTVCSNGNISFHSSSNSTYPVSINKADGNAGSTTYGYINSTPTTGNGSSGSSISLYLTGRLLATGEVDIASDARIKENIDLLDDDFVDQFIDTIQPKKFNYITEPDKVSYGWIAQDIIRGGFNDLINVRPNPEMKEIIDDDGFLNPAGHQFTVMTGNIIAILHHKIKMMDNELRAALARIDDLERNLC